MPDWEKVQQTLLAAGFTQGKVTDYIERYKVSTTGPNDNPLVIAADIKVIIMKDLLKTQLGHQAEQVPRAEQVPQTEQAPQAEQAPRTEQTRLAKEEDNFRQYLLDWLETVTER